MDEIGTIGVGREPWSMDMLLETRLTDEEHQVLGWVPWMESLKERVGNPRLVLIRNRLTERFTICHWVWGPMDDCPPSVRLVSEIEGFEGDPSSAGWPEGLLPWSVLVHRMQPSTGATLRQQLDRRRRAKRERNQETMARREETAQRFERKGQTMTARHIRMSPWSAGQGDASEESKEMIARAASGRVSVGVGAKGE